jgi:exosortase family protein XrtF
MTLLREFRPTILFLGKFLGLYLAGNLLYGAYVTAYYPKPDPVTSWVTAQSAGALTLAGWEVAAVDRPGKPTTDIVYEGRPVIAVYEGCNGLNVVIVFLSFLLAFGPYARPMLWFVPLGLLVIHISNLLRVMLLFIVALEYPDFLYFTHKYLFTAFIYLFVFALWMWWILRYTPQLRNEPA